ncbi:hypothetical protein [Robiginitomaculum antarcticum]|uniref:hypothetical protein n=1 Tax=Robiginitomaculum antarcticum TaxID=437507 RepID=UPI00037FA5D9|nr:hypothetical protein [Robiginitomaculum antarcticum]
MAKPPKDSADNLPPINDDELAAAQARLQARIDQSEARDKDDTSKTEPKAGGKPDAKSASRPIKAGKSPNPPRRSPKPVKRGAGFGAILLFSIIAAGIGGAIGWLGPQYMVQNSPDAGVEQAAQMGQRLAAMETQMAAQGETVSQAQTDLARLSEMDGLQEQIRAIASSVDERAAGLEQAALERAGIIERLDIAETVLAEKGDIAPRRILERISALEAEVTELSETPAPETVYPEGAEPAALLERINAAEFRIAELEARPEPVTVIAEPAPAPSLAQNYDFIGNFPRAAMLAAVNETAQRAAPSNWLQRQLDRHMQSGENRAEQARRDIARAYDLVDRGNIKGAARILKSQSPDVQDAAQAWLAAADTLD